jgi:putative transposon-encoded protein
MGINVNDVPINGYPEQINQSFQQSVQNAILLTGINREKNENKMAKEVTNKVLNSVREYLNFTDNLIKQGLIFEKKVAKFSKTCAAIYLPKRLIGKTFRVLLIPVFDSYEISEPNEKETDKLIKDTEKELNEIQADRKKLIPEVIL